MKIIGLGKAGCSLAQAFSKFPQYETVKIDSNKGADITIKNRDSHEEYDANFPNVKRKLKFTNEDIMLIVCGAGKISGGTLRLLEQLQNNRITILYIQSDLRLLSEVQKKQDRIVNNILQEYARSGAVTAIWLVDNRRVELGIGEVSIMGYYDVLNQAIVNMIHMINVFKNSEPVIGNFINPSELSRIATIGLLEIDEDTESWFYDLTSVRDVVYYYGINEAELKDDGTLFKKITNYISSKLDEKMNVSYGVYKTTYEQRYCYCIQYSSMVQSYKELLADQDIS